MLEFHRTLPTLFSLLAAAVLSGCAAIGGHSGSVNSVESPDQSLAASLCDESTAKLRAISGSSQQRARWQLEAAYVCLNEMEHDLAWEHALSFAAEHGRHPDLDYGHYLAAMSRYLAWQSVHGQESIDPAAGLEEARVPFRLMRDLIREFPDSSYTSDAFAHILALRERMAALEFELAMIDKASGNHTRSQDRLKYIQQYYTETSVYSQAEMALVEMRSRE